MVLEELKQKTRSCHQQIEANRLLAGLMRPEITKDSYVKILRCFHGYYAQLESQLAAFPQWAFCGIDFKSRRKAHLIEEDLMFLEEAKPKDLPVCLDLPALATFEEALGCAYVLEGSTLGGQFITRSVRENLCFTDEKGTLFFNGYGTKTGQMWKAFCEALEKAVKPDDSASVINAAINTFTKFDRWLNRHE